MSPFKQTLRELNAQKGKIAASVGRKTPKRVNRWFKWLSPGLFVVASFCILRPAFFPTVALVQVLVSFHQVEFVQ